MSSYLTTGYGTANTPSTNLPPTTDIGSFFNLSLPIGSIMLYAGTTLPANYLWCDGGVYSTSDTTKIALFNVIQYTYGGSATLTTFNVPDLKSRMPIGSAGTTPIGVTYQSGTSVTGGSRHMTTDQMPAHTHQPPNLDGGSVSYNVWLDGPGTNNPRMALSDSNDYWCGGYDVRNTTASAGSGSEFLLPFCAVNYIIKFS
jgi:microcystin-dependent protein